MKQKKFTGRKVISILLTLALFMTMTFEMAQRTQTVSVQAAKSNKAKDLKAKKAYAKKLRNILKIRIMVNGNLR